MNVLEFCASWAGTDQNNLYSSQQWRLYNHDCDLSILREEHEPPVIHGRQGTHMDTSHLQQRFTVHSWSPVLEHHLKGKKKKIVGVTAPQIVADTSLSSSTVTHQRWKIMGQNPMICQKPQTSASSVLQIIKPKFSFAKMMEVKNNWLYIHMMYLLLIDLFSNVTPKHLMHIIRLIILISCRASWYSFGTPFVMAWYRGLVPINQV